MLRQVLNVTQWVYILLAVIFFVADVIFLAFIFILSFLTHSFPMHPFSTPSKHFRGVEIECIENEWVTKKISHIKYSFQSICRPGFGFYWIFFHLVTIYFSGIDLDAAIRILEHIEDYSTISEPPVKPKGGEMFIYLPANTQEQGNLSFRVRRQQRCSLFKCILDELLRSFISKTGNRQAPSNLNFLYERITFEILSLIMNKFIIALEKPDTWCDDIQTAWLFFFF